MKYNREITSMSSFVATFDDLGRHKRLVWGGGVKGTEPNLWTTRASGLWTAPAGPVDDLWVTEAVTESP